MADQGSERDDESEPLSATGMFLRNFSAPPQEPERPEPAPAVTSAEVQRVEAGEFTRMFRPLGVEAAQPASRPSPASSLPSASATPAAGDFTRMFTVPGPPKEEPRTTQPSASKAKGFSAPGVSDSASAEGALTRVLRQDSEPVPPARVLAPQTEETQRPSQNQTAPALFPEILAQTGSQSREDRPQTTSITEMFRALAPEGERYPAESPFRPETVPVSPPVPYAEPVRINQHDHSQQIAPAGGGVTELLSRLTQETPVMQSTAVPVPFSRPQMREEVSLNATPADTRGEFTRIIQASEINAALGTPAPGPAKPASTTSPALAIPAVPLVTVPLPLPAGPTAPAQPHLAIPAAPKLPVVPALALPSTGKSKLQEMMPLLLVANAFLMLVLILLVVFALHRR